MRLLPPCRTNTHRAMTTRDQKVYCAIIGDINKSRTLPGRNRVQKRFRRAVETVNREFRDDIASPFLITLGDEFQGLLLSPVESHHLVNRFRQLMQPVSFAFGVGIGTLSTPLNSSIALGMDGDAFYRARSALSIAKARKRTLTYGVNAASEELINALVALMDRQWRRLTPRQQQISRMLRQHNAKDVARRLRISPQAVSKARSAAGAAELDEAAAALRRFLGHLVRPHRPGAKRHP